jgi:hypothetical protein
VTMRVNGVTTVDGDFPTMPDKGIIAWQMHGPKTPREVVFKDITLLELTSPSVAKLPQRTPPGFTTIFDGSSKGWFLCDGGPLPKANVQSDGLNPHGTDSYMVAYAQPIGDFELDFDYKLTKGGTAGVFVRVSDLDDPVDSGLEVPLGTAGTGTDSAGAFRYLVANRLYAEKPAGEWNQMRITAAGPRLAVSLNRQEVSTINLDEWSVARQMQRPDERDLSAYKDVAVGKLPRVGYIGFQGLYNNCWIRNIRVSSRSLGNQPAPVAPAFVERGMLLCRQPGVTPLDGWSSEGRMRARGH